MFKRSFQEVRNFAPEATADQRAVAAVETSPIQIRLEPEAFVEAVISRLDEIVAQGLGRSPLMA